MKNYKEMLKNQECKIAVWGAGYIGFSNLCLWGKNGINSTAIDINPNVVNSIMNNNMHLNEFDYWLGFDYSYLIEKGVFSVSTDWQVLKNENILFHLICVPTEKDGIPNMDAVFDVADKIAHLENDTESDETLIIIESTLTPGSAEKIEERLISKIINKKVHFGVSPRRDWFMSGDKNMENLSRVYGGNSEEANKVMKDVLSIICRNLVEASDYRHAEIVKTVENAFRHVDIALANQLALAFPHLNMREVLVLAGTKWNMNTYYPSFGTGGYCIPLSSKYLLEGSSKPEILTLLKNTVDFEENLLEQICGTIMKWNVKNVGILGVSYKEDIKVDKLSPAVRILKYLKEKGINIKLNDCYYSEEEIKARFKVDYFNEFDMQSYNQFDAIIIISAHRNYKLIDRKKIIANLSKCKVIFDNTGMWEDFEELKNLGIEYKLAGAKNWI